jgi:putative exosortase-associated protein (TIGR04073 family)
MKLKSLIAVVLLVLAVGTPLFAEEATVGDYFYGIGTKFARGLENTVTSLAEIPCTMSADIKDKGAVGSMTGFGKGTLFMLRRMLVGVTEVGTFFIPMERTIPRVCTEETAKIPA